MKSATLQAHEKRMTRMLAHLHAHLDQPLKVDSLARLSGLSRRQSDRLAERLIGESLNACLRRLRLERAARQLRDTRGRILTIALDAGFDSHESFTRSFSRYFGHNPTAYRRLPAANLQPRDRGVYWRLALAGGLRRYVEQPAAAPTSRLQKGQQILSHSRLVRR